MSLKYYNSITLNDDIIMSCDMLRLSFSLSNDKLSDFNRYIINYEFKHSNIKVKLFRSHTLFQFANLLQIHF